MAESSEQSEFNYAISFLNRLNTIFYACNEASTRKDAAMWLDQLVILRREMSDDMTKEELEDTRRQIDVIFKAMQPVIARTSRIGRPYIPSDIYWALNDLEMALRKKIKDTGYKTKWREDVLEPDREW